MTISAPLSFLDPIGQAVRRFARRARFLPRRMMHALRGRPDRFLKDVSGVVHVGANTGQERMLYAAYGLAVIWVEPIPDVFARLVCNIAGLPGQQAFQALLTDVDDRDYEFHIANNDGASSSILEFGQHRDIWPGVEYTGSIRVRSQTLATLLENRDIDASRYDALILDTQGSELLVLQGGVPVLERFEFIKLEVADFESYRGCCQLADVEEFMARHDYAEVSRRKFASRAGGGSYYDVVYRRR